MSCSGALKATITPRLLPGPLDRLSHSGTEPFWHATQDDLDSGPEEVGTDHVSDHALRFSSDVSIGRMYRLSFCRNCES